MTTNNPRFTMLADGCFRDETALYALPITENEE